MEAITTLSDHQSISNGAEHYITFLPITRGGGVIVPVNGITFDR